ncbi:MAG TPA: 6-carboxytetrahydropterin synthase [Candidatus Omnitrophota bacterium]|nr:6-carboxytetrahydropterin synthase [Candidatus Omnitrophota bacterium]HPS37207.1 6-carboxytetrahydropterin synthase [Candidatus Omnitrophota bacterium]
MFKVAKTIYFNYGHRLMGGHDKCSRLHGHSARVEIEMSSPKLDRQGMVVNFFDIRKTIGDWIEKNLDHRMILSETDPLAGLLRKAGELVVTVKGNPTAEVLAEKIFCAAKRMKLPVSKVTLWENQDSFAVYEK